MNPSFEDTVEVKTTPLYLPAFWEAATREGFNYFTNNNIDIDNNWIVPDNVVGYQLPKHGESYIGINIYDLSVPQSPFREYPQTKLIKPLIMDSVYCIQFYTSLADSMTYASRRDVGIYFSVTKVSSNTRSWLPYSPQLYITPDTFITDKDKWVKINLEYKAEGGEEYFLMGNFNDNSVRDSMNVSGGGNQLWMRSAYYYYDDFYIGSCDSLPEDTSIGLIESSYQNKIEIYPNPANNKVTILNAGGVKRIQFWDMQGRVVQDKRLINNTIDVSKLDPGVYVLKLIGNGLVISRRIVINSD